MLLYDSRYAWVITNKPTQYTLTCDRQANDLGKFFALHPAVLRVLKMATNAAHKRASGLVSVGWPTVWLVTYF